MGALEVEEPRATRNAAPRFVLEEGAGALASMSDAWEELAVPSGTPLLTPAWLLPWVETRARGPVVCATPRFLAAGSPWFSDRTIRVRGLR